MHMKKIKRSIIVILIVLALFLPIPTGLYDDGGTREYSALTYKIVDWNKMIYNDANDSIEIYENTSVYWFPDNFKSIDELWEIEKEKNVKRLQTELNFGCNLLFLPVYLSCQIILYFDK